MFKIILIFVFTSFSVSSVCQKKDRVDFLNDIQNYDLSEVLCADSIRAMYEDKLIERPPVLGFIGDDYQRVKIRFISVIKNSSNPLLYHVYGKTNVKGNVCEFQGIIEITKCTWQTKDRFGDESGTVSGTYHFSENPNQYGSGILTGTFESLFQLLDNKPVFYELIPADSFCTNQFEGIWTSYLTGKSKVCNWGDFRIPSSGDLDQGAGHFSPHPQYYNQGWEFYEVMFGAYDKLKTERKKIWKENLRKEYAKWW